MSDERKRPDPDALLDAVHEESERKNAGRLKVFFGYAAGVGKTYTMLQAAHLAAESGIDTVVGYVEPHSRPDTLALLDGLESVPQKTVEYRQLSLRELDPDAVLSRRPELVVVDELAHTNAPGMRHAKRWQDVEEFLSSGISVYTTLNVQHLESLNDIIARITGITVKETVPDRIFEQADRVELVDVPPEELLQRLREGKIYVPEQAARAADNFFQKANLSALREIALRRTADSVNAELELSRRVEKPGKIWPTGERVAVSVSSSKTSAKLIRSAARLASSLRGDLIAIHVEMPSSEFGSEKYRHQLNENLHLAESLGAETVTLRGEDIPHMLIDYAKMRNVTKIVIGKNLNESWLKKFRKGIVEQVIALSDDIDIYVIRGDESPEKPTFSSARISKQWHFSVKNTTMTVLVMALVTGVAMLVNRAGFSESDVVMLYMLGVAGCAALFGRGPDIVATLIGVLSFNFFFTEPYYTFMVKNIRYIITFLVMGGVSIVISSMTARIRKQTENARQREKRTESLYRLNRHLAGTTGLKDLATVAVRELSRAFPADVSVFLANDQRKLKVLVPQNHDYLFLFEPNEMAVAEWAFNNGRIAGSGTDTLPSSKGLYIPLQGSAGPFGVLAVYLEDSETHRIPEQKRLLETFSTQIALAMERDILSDEKQKVLLQIEAERMKTSFLQSLSHDFRTPLTGINGACSVLLDTSAEYDRETKTRLLKTIQEETRWLSQLVENLLSITRIEAEAVPVSKQWQPVEEVVGSAVSRIEASWPGRTVLVSLAEGMSMASFDAVLIEQVLINLMDNALKYSPEKTPVELRVREEKGSIVFSVLDRGRGISDTEKKAVFDKFYRTQDARASGARGAGLGLAICSAIVAMHKGSIWVEDREGGGSVFLLSIPLGGTPPALPEGYDAEEQCHE